MSRMRPMRFLILGVSLAVAMAFMGCAGSKPKPPAGTAAADSAKASTATGPRTQVPAGSPAPAAGKSAPATGADGKAVAQPSAASGVSVTTEPGPPERRMPLVMENAERMEGSRSRGEYVLIGNVRFTHGELRLETEKAIWNKDRNVVFCESGMRITHRGSLLTANGGSYDKALGQAVAEGNVKMRDSSGEVEARGKTLVYDRGRHMMTLSGNPELKRFYKEADSAERAASAAAKDSVTDTLVIHGKTMTYDDSLGVAVAEGDVRIRRDRLQINCKRAEYHEKADSLFLLGEPQVKVDDSRVKGKSMRLSMRGEDIRSLLVKGEAEANSLEPATDTSVARQSRVEGDSLFMAFKDKVVDSVQVFKNAKGSYYDVDQPEFVNRMSGEYMVLRFSGRQVRSANVFGRAKSSYWHFETKKLKGRNDAEGDTIDFAFKEGKVEEVMVRGSAKGVYFGEDKKRRGGKLVPDSAKSASARPADTASAASGSAAGKAAAPAAAPKNAAAKPAAAPGPGANPAPEPPGAERRPIPNPWRKK